MNKPKELILRLHLHLWRKLAMLGLAKKFTEVQTEYGGRLRLDIREPACFCVYIHKNYPFERYSDKIFNELIQPGFNVIDVGANIGYYTVFYSQLVGTDGKVFAYEPVPKAYEIAAPNFRDTDNVILRKIALGDNDTSIDLYITKWLVETSVHDVGGTSKITVEQKKIDTDIDPSQQIDFIKIDVEGHEMNVLEGARNTIARCRPYAYFELLNQWKKINGIGFEEFKSFFDQFNYTLYSVGPDDRTINLNARGKIGSYCLALPNEKVDDLLANKTFIVHS